MRYWLLSLSLLACHADPVPPPANQPVTGEAAEHAASLPVAAPADSSAVAQLENAFESVADAVNPSVVSVSSIRLASGDPDEEDDQPFLPHFSLPRPGTKEREQGLGSGFVIDARGYILTNNHVVEGAEDLTVWVSDKRKLKASIVGADAKTDVAVIKVDATDLKPLPLGDSKKLRVGQWVVAVGSPFGLEHTVTAGIVSATGRSNVGIADFEDFIQTDAAINQGNSGGPLVNLRGEVVGINTAILSRSGGSLGVGFAIPTAMAVKIVEQLMAHGKVVRGWLGVSLQELTPQLAHSFAVHDNGVLVSEVSLGGPAQKAGLLAGDVMTAIDAEPIHDLAWFRQIIAEKVPGASVMLSVVRERTPRQLAVKVGELPGIASPALPGAAKVNDIGIGMTLAEITPVLRQRYELEAKARGALVVEVVPGLTADEAGVQPGQLIVEIDRLPVRTAKDARKILTPERLRRGVLLRVHDDAGQKYVALQKE